MFNHCSLVLPWVLFLSFSSEVTTETRLYSYPMKYSAFFLFYKVIFFLLLKDSFAVSYWSLLCNKGNWLYGHKYPVISHTLLLFGGASMHLWASLSLVRRSSSWSLLEVSWVSLERCLETPHLLCGGVCRKTERARWKILLSAENAKLPTCNSPKGYIRNT